jgi:hypothetical protein
VDIPRADHKPCIACAEPIVFMRETGRTKGGLPAVVAIDPVPTATGKWAVSAAGGHWYAGKVKSNQAAGMREHGVKLHTAHNDTCTKKDEFIRKKRGAYPR